MNILLLGRISILIGIGIGLIAWWTTAIHIGDPNYVLIDASTAKPTHPWHHNFHEVLGDLAAMTIFLLVFFGPARFRIPETWLITLILMIGYYIAFWIGTPFIPELASDRWTGEAIHIGMTAFSLAALFITKSEFTSK
ncbi:MAG: hypothetical protein ABJO86_01945 [Lentilitoribacter sp.]